MSCLLDVHVNLIPTWARVKPAELDMSCETRSMVRAFKHPDAAKFNALCSPEAILSSMDEAGVSRSVVFSYQWKDAERCEMANAAVANAVRAYPDRLYGLAVCQPANEKSVNRLGHWLDQPGMLGVKLKPKWGNFSLADTALIGPMCEILCARGGVLLTHVSQNFHASQGDNVCDLVVLLRNFPNLTVIAAHLGGFLDTYRLHEPIGKLMENLYFDISLPANLAWLPYLMRLGNPERYLFATDFPYTGFDEMLERVRGELGLTEREIRLLCEENPKRLLAAVGVSV